MLHDGPQRYAYALTNATALYVGSTRLTGDCPLRRSVGSSALVWSAGEAHTTIAERVTIAPLPSKRP